MNENENKFWLDYLDTGYKKNPWPWLRWSWVEPGYMQRMPLIPRNPWLKIYLHRWHKSDRREDGLHDHPSWSFSVRLWGPPLHEWTFRDPEKRGEGIVNKRCPRFMFRKATHSHAVQRIISRVTLTLFIMGPVQREWGFWSDTGWKPYRVVLKARAARILGSSR